MYADTQTLSNLLECMIVHSRKLFLRDRELSFSCLVLGEDRAAWGERFAPASTHQALHAPGITTGKLVFSLACHSHVPYPAKY